MKQAISDDLISFSSLMMLAHDRGEIIQLAQQLNNIIEKAMEIENSNLLQIKERKTLSASIKFTKKEIDMMSKTFKKEFIANGCVAHIIKRPSGKKNFYYEIRYRRNGYNITASNTNLATAKKEFIEKTKYLDSPQTITQNKLKFGNVINEWLEYKKNKISYHQWQNHESRARRLIPEDLKNKSIKEIRTNDINKLLNFNDNPRTYEELRSLFNQTFKYAIASGIISHNPTTLIPFIRAERESRIPLTKEQIKNFFTRLKEPQFEKIRQVAYTFYFFGVRPCEIDKELRIENDFLICRNRKRKNGKIEYKKIPIPAQAREYINFTAPIKYPLSYSKSAAIIKKALDNDLTPYNLRHTFATQCSQYVREEFVDVWMGDSPDRLIGKVYIKFSDEFMKSEMNKVIFVT